MSRVSLPGKDATVLEVVIGIDPPLQCWFVQVYGPDPGPDEEHDPFVWHDIASRSQVIEAMIKSASTGTTV